MFYFVPRIILGLFSDRISFFDIKNRILIKVCKKNDFEIDYLIEKLILRLKTQTKTGSNLEITWK